MTNRFMGTSTVYEPKIGDGATILYWSDRRAYTIINVSKTGNTVVLQQDIAVRVDKGGPYTESQKYEFRRNCAGSTAIFTRRKNGQFIRKGDPLRGGQVAVLGSRMEYTDPTF